MRRASPYWGIEFKAGSYIFAAVESDGVTTPFERIMGLPKHPRRILASKMLIRSPRALSRARELGLNEYQYRLHDALLGRTVGWRPAAIDLIDHLLPDPGRRCSRGFLEGNMRALAGGINNQ